jgi:hypothetical protein
VLQLTQKSFDQRQNPEQMAAYHRNLAEHFERLKMASAKDPQMFYQYGQQQFENEALAHYYKAMSHGMQPMGGMMNHSMMGGM